jgi:hypothetical protein
MVRRWAERFLKKETARQTWTQGPSDRWRRVSDLAKVRIADSLLAGIGRKDDALDDIAFAIHNIGPEEDETPERDVEVATLTITPTKGRPRIAYAVFHEGKYWISGRRFLPL